MGTFPNPVLIAEGDTPITGDVPVFNATTGQWSAASPVETITVPQDAIDNTAAPTALTAAPVGTADATAAGVGYLQATAATWVALANALKVELNKVITDLGTLRTEHGALVTAHNTLLAELATADILEAP